MTRRLLLPIAVYLCTACASTNSSVDEAITQTVVHRLIHENAVNLTRVEVQTNDGTVYLSGEVQNHHQKERAEQIARSVQGVQHVVNKVELQP